MSLYDLNNDLKSELWECLEENWDFSHGDEQCNGFPIHSIPVPGNGGQYTPQSMQGEGSQGQHTPQSMQLEGSQGQHTPQSMPGNGGQHTTQSMQVQANEGQYTPQIMPLTPESMPMTPQSMPLEGSGGQPTPQTMKLEGNGGNFTFFEDSLRVPERLPDRILSTEEQPNTAVTEGGRSELLNTAITEGGMVASPVSLQQNVRTQPFTVSPDEQSHVPMPDIGPQETQLTMMHQQQVALPVSNAQALSNTFQNAGTLFLTTMPQQPPLVIMPPQQTHVTTVTQKGGGVVDVPALTDMEGEYSFSVSIEEKERTTKSPMWLMSKITKKLYTNINKAVPFEIRLKKEVPREFHIRAVTVFSSAQFLRTNVTRCPNHASPADVTNHDFPYPAHVLRADHPKAEYEKSPNGRLSVVVPLDILQDGSDYTPILLRFMCLGSCVGGINRRPIAIILTLENNAGQLFGRKVIDVRVCACPTRDIRTDEQTLMNKGVKRRGSSLQDKPQVVIRKKPKTTTTVVEPKSEPPEDDKILWIPVRGQKLYDLLTGFKEVYYRSHPEYAEKYPDDCRRICDLI